LVGNVFRSVHNIIKWIVSTGILRSILNDFFFPSYIYILGLTFSIKLLFRGIYVFKQNLTSKNRIFYMI